MSQTPTDFEQACGAFDLLTFAERELVLKEFARLRYPSIAERFFEAVYLVITKQTTARLDGEAQP